MKKILIISISFLLSFCSIGIADDAYKIGNEEKGGSTEDLVPELKKKIDEVAEEVLRRFSKRLEEALEMVKSAVVITISEDSKFICISRLEEWSKQSIPLKEDKIDIDSMEDKTLELYKEKRDLTKVILVVAKDTEYKHLWKVINLYEKSLHNLEEVDVNSIRYIFAKPR